MATQEQTLDIHTYIDIALRRKWYIIIPLVLSVAIAFGVYKTLPKIYSATTLILVQPQRVPTDYVRPTITDSVTSRLSTIGQEILSRTRLESVIQEFNLYADLRSKLPMEEIVETMRKAVEVKVLSGSQYDRGQNSFSVSYEGKEPRTVMMVTNKLASLFIEENLRGREQQAGRTSEFIVKELQDMEGKLKNKEIEIRDFKARNMGQLPQQWEANQRTLDRLQQQLQTTTEAIRAVEDKTILYRNQIEQLRERGRIVAGRMARGDGSQGVEGISGESGFEDPVIVQYNSLKRELTAAQSKYTDQHPDVVELKRKIANLEPKVKEILNQQKAMREARGPGQKDGVGGENMFPLDPTTERLLTQYTDQYNGAQLDAKRLRSEEKNLREQIFAYQRRVEETPKREQELSLLTRDYELMKSNYQSLLDKKIQAQMAENLERDQQGEQFKILDPARIPEKPIRPDRNKILIAGLVIGLALGGGLTWFRESLDQSFHTVAQVEGYLGVPVLVAIPNLKEDKGLPYYQRGKKVA
jgi:polysaccharide chain length determinant protein (PEP-CTERM system associated)